jgi:hypothetical protein
MAQFFAPGVYVQEVPSAVQPIAGVGTSTAGFIGIFPDSIEVPVSRVSNETVAKNAGSQKSFPLRQRPVLTEAGTYKVLVAGAPVNATLTTGDAQEAAQVTLTDVHEQGAITVTYTTKVDLAATATNVVVEETVGKWNDKQKTYRLKQYPVQNNGSKKVMVGTAEKTSDATLVNEDVNRFALVQFAENTSATDDAEIKVTYTVQTEPKLAPAGVVKLCTSFGDFTKYFGGFSTCVRQRNLAHAVHGFFMNGGTRCYVVRMQDKTAIDTVLEKLATIDEIAIVAAPGIVDADIRDKLLTHCKQTTGDRFAILDSAETVGSETDLDLTLLDPSNPDNLLPADSDYAAFYFPWLQVADPATKILHPQGDGRIFVPPSGHMAGIYARVDANRGVHKAPANEPVLGALGLKYTISKAQQDGLNPQGVNCIRNLNGNIRVWGARTLGGDLNGEWRYINVRRLFLFLRESIDQGTQWVVFEPNEPGLWAKITRNITAFLTNVWRAGALFGNTPAEAFYVKCDAETNPPEVRELGQVVTEIGVAVVKPAEFVVFRISQWAGPGQ